MGNFQTPLLGSFHPALTDGKPLIPPTSVKGMLRSAYEALTNSRFGVFEDHDKRLGMRPDPGEALRMVPAIVQGKTIRLLRGTTEGWPKWDTLTGKNNLPNNRWSLPTGRAQYAAWLPMRTDNNNSWAWEKQQRGSHFPAHGQHVKCRIKRKKHSTKKFAYWSVTEMCDIDGDLPHSNESKYCIGKDVEQLKQEEINPDGERFIDVDGWVVINNFNIENKHDERVFFNCGAQEYSDLLTEKLRSDWNTLMAHVADLHRESNNAPEQPDTSRHVLEARQGLNTIPEDGVPEDRPLLCYARVQPGGAKGATILGLYPVMIPRLLQETAPAELLPASHRPATKLSELSPADRVFGWANQKGAGAWRGQLRVGTVSTTAKPEEAIHDFGADGLPLAILGQPKPGQWRFYGANDPQGTRLPDLAHPRLSRDAHTDAGRIGHRAGLRGRKVYPHHAVLEVGEKAPHQDFAAGYWDPKGAEADLNAERVGRGLCREYRRPVPHDAKPEDGNKAARDTQNRTIQAWIKPGVTFSFDLHVTNLSATELGALLWLLDERAREPERDRTDGAPCRAIHRLGLGKPLGFGAVELAISGLDLRDGAAIRADYSGFGKTATEGDRLTGPADIADCVPLLTWREAETGTLDAPLDAPHHRALIAAAWGLGHTRPVHAPRTRQKPEFKGENFNWFVENEKGGGHAKPRTLPALGQDSDLSLPFDPREGV